jgi:hypothetical protein
VFLVYDDEAGSNHVALFLWLGCKLAPSRCRGVRLDMPC